MLSMNKLILRIFYAEKKSWNKVRERETLKFFEREVYLITVVLLIPFAQGFTKKLHVFKTVWITGFSIILSFNDNFWPPLSLFNFRTSTDVWPLRSFLLKNVVRYNVNPENDQLSKTARKHCQITWKFSLSNLHPLAGSTVQRLLHLGYVSSWFWGTWCVPN